MRILLVTGHYFMAEGTIAKGIVKALNTHEVFFFCVHSFKDKYNEFVDLTKKVDVVHWLFNVGHLDKKYLHIFRGLKVPNITTVHHVDSDEIYKIQEASFANMIHVVSSEWLTFLKTKTKTKVNLSYLGIFSEKFENKTSNNLYKGEGTFKIGMMGFYPGKNNRKRVDVAIDTLRILISKNVDIELIVQGKGWEKYYNEFNEIGLKFTHYKFRPDSNVLSFFEKIHVYMCTSDIEGGPLPVLESMASGVPVVSTKVGLSIDLLNNGGGVLCEKGNVEQITEAIVQLKEDNDLYKKFAGETKYIAKNFDWGNLEQQYYSLYKNTITSWEEKNASNWEYKTTDTIKPEKQRKRELIYGNIPQIRSLLNNNNIKDGIRILIISILSNKIDFTSKIKVLRESMFYIFNRK